MLALLMANRVIAGTQGYKFKDVPNSLKDQVYYILKENGVEHLADGYIPTTWH